MTNLLKSVLLLALTAPAPLAAQTIPAPTSNAAATSFDPERLTVARALMEQIMPTATRDQMTKSMMASMSQYMMQALRKNPDLEAALKAEPRAQQVFDRFLDRQMALGTEDLITNLPGMLDAMARAYARRFTLAQLNDMSAFFSTPSGQTYLTKAPTIMADPDVGAWMNSLMTRSMQRMPEQMARLKSELEALDKKSATQ